jgi:site-specific recombinase XerD
MDKPADPATPFREVYQHFLAILKEHGRDDSTRAKYLYDFERFERWLRETGRPLTLASLMDTDLLFTYRHHLETLPQQARGSIRQRNDGMLSNKTIHSYLRSARCLASWLTKNGHIAAHPFLALDPYFKDEGVMPVLRKMDRIAKIATPADIRILLTACAGLERRRCRTITRASVPAV